MMLQEDAATKKSAPVKNPSQMSYDEYVKNIQDGIGGQKDKMGPPRSFGTQSLGQNLEGHLGQGAPKLQGDDPSALKLKQPQFYNPSVLYGSQSQLTTDKATSDLVMAPYKNLQRIKRMESNPLIAAAGVPKAIMDIEKANLENKPYGEEPFKNFDHTKSDKDIQGRKKQLKNIGIAVKKLVDKNNQDDIDAINDAYEHVKQHKELFGTGAASKANAPQQFQNLVLKHSIKMAGMGGSDPFFGEKLAYQLLVEIGLNKHLKILHHHNNLVQFQQWDQNQQYEDIKLNFY
jgi:hypothetical protein